MSTPSLFLEFNGLIGGNFAENDQKIAQITSEWHQQLLPKIKAVYSEGKPTGYIFIAWIMPGMDIKNRPAEKVIKEYFGKF